MLQLLLFTPLSSTVYLVIYRSGQLEKTNNILNAKTHAMPASVPVIACLSLRVLPGQSLGRVRPVFTLLSPSPFSTDRGKRPPPAPVHPVSRLPHASSLLFNFLLCSSKHEPAPYPRFGYLRQSPARFVDLSCVAAAARLVQR